jgi:YHS domain-containing protein
MLNKRLHKFTLLFLLFSFMTVFNYASANSLDQPTLEQRVPLALDGYDVITYFNLSGATLGQDRYQGVYRGKRYLFSSSENQQKFAKDPLRYLPQFDGLCAHSIAMQKDMLANPAIYTLQDGKLYMFYNEEARQQWSLDKQQNLVAANQHWTYKAEKRNAQIDAKNLWKKENRVKLFSF